MIDLNEFIGLEYDKPYNCFTLVKEIRKRLGLPTPTLYPPSLIECVTQIQEHKHCGIWHERHNVYTGELGDIVLLSRSAHLPAHHMGVVIDKDSIVHIDYMSTVSLLPISRIPFSYPGVLSRWGTTPSTYPDTAADTE